MKENRWVVQPGRTERGNTKEWTDMLQISKNSCRTGNENLML